MLHTHKKTSLYLAVLTSLGLLHSPLTFAQEDDSDDFEVIKVTANRTVSIAEKTPVALSVMDSRDLRDQGITNPTSIGDVSPNISIDRATGLQITIRGVTSTDGTEKGDPSAAFMLDSVYIARPQAQEVSFFDIERVEVLRGPQGTLYGRNTTAGLINVIAKKPNEFLESGFDVTLGNYNSRQVSGFVNVPVNDTLAFRAAINLDSRDNYLDTSSDTIDISDYKDNRSVRLSALYSGIEDASLLVQFDYSSIQGNGYNTAPTSNFYQTPFTAPADGELGVSPVYIDQDRADYVKLDAPNLIKPSADNSTWGTMLDFTYNISDEWMVNYLGSYRKFDREEELSLFITSDPTTAEKFYYPSPFIGDYNQTSHELRLAYDKSGLQAQVGLYYFREKSNIELDILGLIGAQEGDFGYVFGFPQKPTISESVGVFGQATYSVTDDLRLTAGIRATNDKKSRRGATIFHEYLSDEINFDAADSLNYANVKYSETTWKLGVDYDFSDLTMLYATLATGYKAGGFNDGCIEGEENCNSPLPEAAVYYDPETLTSLEIGLKTRLLKNKMTFNANYFHYDYQDLQLSQVSFVCGGPCQVTTNAAEATVDGIEIESVYRPNANHGFNANFTWLDATYDDWEIVPGANFGGQKLSRSPEFTVAGGYKYTMELASGAEMNFAISTKWSDEYFITNNTLRANFGQPSYSKSDVTVTYNSPDRTWYVQGFVKNIEDEITVSNVTTNGDLQNGTVSFTDPRLFGVRFGYQF